MNDADCSRKALIVRGRRKRSPTRRRPAVLL